MTVRELTVSAAVIIYVTSLSLVKDQYGMRNPVSPQIGSKFNYVIKSQGWLITVFSYLLLQRNKNIASIVQGLLYTTNWYVFTRLFNLTHYLTKSCIQDGISIQSSKAECIKAGLEWYDGFDISGHTFLLTFAIMLLHSSLRQSEGAFSFSLVFGRLFSCVYIVFCIFMLSITALYYHTLPQKVVAALCSVSSFWFLKINIQKLQYRSTVLSRSKKTE